MNCSYCGKEESVCKCCTLGCGDCAKCMGEVAMDDEDILVSQLENIDVKE